uniref:Uncharacterized protein n=1 Tax=Strongyloides papillosus TaxID=174720 RepID=A0A0N5C6Y1_STREA
MIPFHQEAELEKLDKQLEEKVKEIQNKVYCATKTDKRAGCIEMEFEQKRYMILKDRTDECCKRLDKLKSDKFKDKFLLTRL